MQAIANIKQGWAEFQAMDARDKRSKIIDTLLNNAIYILLVIFVIFTATRNANFLTISSLVNIISLAASSLPIALGIGGCIVLTGTDLSAGRVVGLTAAISAAMLQASDWANKMFDNLPEMPIPVVILAVILVGGIVRLVHGLFVPKFRLHPLTVTLATQLIVYGVLLEFYMLNGNNGQPLSGLSDTYRNFITGTMFSIPTGNGQSVAVPWYVLYAVLLVIIMWFVWNKTTFGKSMFAVGSNPEAANVSGVNVFMTTMMVHTLAGCMYGIEGFIESARIASNTANTGLNYESDAIAACVIGGVSFVGGTGKISGIVLGVFLLRIIFVALNMLSISGNTQYIIKGLIILIACSIDMRKYLVKK